jgi:hypothetical protein
MSARIRVSCLMLEQLEIRSLLTGFLTPGGTDPIAIPAAVGAAVLSYPDPTAPLGSPTNPIYGGVINGGAVTPTPGGTDPIAIPAAVGATGGAGQASGGSGLVLRTPAARYVDKLFATFLDRAPTQSDRTFWTGVVRRYGARSAAREIADSPEARIDGPPGSPTNPIYGGVIGGGAFPPRSRGSDPITIPGVVGATGFSYPDPAAPLGSATNPIYLGLIGGGSPPRSRGSDPIGIPEVVGATGGAGQASGGTGLVLDTPAARYVDQLFVTDLGRAPTQSDLTFWSGVIRHDGTGYAAREIVNAPEAKLLGA